MNLATTHLQRISLPFPLLWWMNESSHYFLCQLRMISIIAQFSSSISHGVWIQLTIVLEISLAIAKDSIIRHPYLLGYLFVAHVGSSVAPYLPNLITITLIWSTWRSLCFGIHFSFLIFFFFTFSGYSSCRYSLFSFTFSFIFILFRSISCESMPACLKCGLILFR